MRLKAAMLAGIASLVFAQAALAVGRDRLSYTELEASFGRVTTDNSDASADLFDIRASLDLGGPVPVFVSASRTEIEPDATQIAWPLFSARGTISRIGLGFHFGNDSTANFVPSISLVETKAEFINSFALIPDQSATGWAARTALRALVRPWLELGAFFEMTFISEEATPTVAIEGILYPFRHLGVGVGYETSEGQQTVSARARIVR